MENFWVLVLLIIAVVLMGFYLGRSSKEHEQEMEDLMSKQNAKEEALKNAKAVRDAPIDSIRDRLRNDAPD